MSRPRAVKPYPDHNSGVHRRACGCDRASYNSVHTGSDLWCSSIHFPYVTRPAHRLDHPHVRAAFLLVLAPFVASLLFAFKIPSQFFFTAFGSSARGNLIRLPSLISPYPVPVSHQPPPPSPLSAFPAEDVTCKAYLNPASIVSFVLRPNSFSSRLIRVAAADIPMKSAKTGSRLREMRWAAAVILVELRIYRE